MEYFNEMIENDLKINHNKTANITMIVWNFNDK